MTMYPNYHQNAPGQPDMCAGQASPRASLVGRLSSAISEAESQHETFTTRLCSVITPEAPVPTNGSVPCNDPRAPESELAYLAMRLERLIANYYTLMNRVEV